ncbi:Protein YIPF6 [Hondaea fermentalgiana]|uniref:Protein YIPF n=1 Tax=Hondaea fermentalgiana TaxID=2315210 RepID=A0A2R5GBK7_9STRA|nr:Protein YIPF6 [Hondaea fermentalgiana]|eukprot:GBG28370.1 Protein YIPF6 [Hondaea fermentalgiana]
MTETSQHDAELMTLDEPVLETIKRDLKMIGAKLKFVFMPTAKSEDTIAELRKWDLWGPLLFCLILSVVLSVSASEDQGSTVFACVFVVVWVGAFIVTLNVQLLGGKVPNFQSVCVLGYCICPLVLAAVLGMLWNNIFFKLALVAAGYAWAMRAPVVFMAQLVSEEKKALAVFPVGLFYLVIAWMIVII